MGRDPEPPQWAVPGVSGPGDGERAGADLVAEAEVVFAEFVASSRGTTAEEQLVALRRTLDQLEGLWMSAGAAFAQSGDFAGGGHRSLAAWLSHRCRLSPSEASARSTVAASISGDETATAKAVKEGSISWRHALVVTQALSKVPDDRRVEAETTLVDEATRLDPGQLRRVADRLLHCLDRESAEEAAVRRLERRGLSVAETIDGMVSVSGLLDPITGATLLTALATCSRPRTSGHDHGDGHSGSGATDGSPARGRYHLQDGRSPAQRRADALAEICREWLETADTGTSGGARPHLSVIVDQPTLASPHADTAQRVEPAQLSWVGPITASEAQLIGCDSVVSRIVMSGPSQVIDVGRATRTIPPALRRAVAARDRTCVGPGCHRLPEQCDVHHVVFWEHGGETSLSNTVLLCRYHHQLVHLQHWRVTMDTTGRRALSPPR